MVWRGAWLTESDLLQLPNGKIALDKYVLNKVPLRKKKKNGPLRLPPKNRQMAPKTHHLYYNTNQP